MKKISFYDRFRLTAAVLRGQKTQARFAATTEPPYEVGEIVAVAQAYADFYNEECDPRQYPKGAGWINKRYAKPELMPHRIRITDMREERLQDISDEDCMDEGVCKIGEQGCYCFFDNVRCEARQFSTAREAFAALIGKGEWERNPEVYVYKFELTDKE